MSHRKGCLINPVLLSWPEVVLGFSTISFQWINVNDFVGQAWNQDVSWVSMWPVLVWSKQRQLLHMTAGHQKPRKRREARRHVKRLADKQWSKSDAAQCLRLQLWYREVWNRAFLSERSVDTSPRPGLLRQRTLQNPLRMRLLWRWFTVFSHARRPCAHHTDWKTHTAQTALVFLHLSFLSQQYCLREDFGICL